MPKSEVRYRRSKLISSAAVHGLFLRNGWKDWHTRRDTKEYIARALFVASAWLDGKAIGIGALYGDGRFTTSIETLLVDQEFRKRGIGTTLLKILLAAARRRHPYSLITDVHLKKTERMYARLGFKRHKGSVYLDHGPTQERFIAHVEKSRAARKKLAGRKSQGISG